jgi:hypothetical protein
MDKDEVKKIIAKFLPNVVSFTEHFDSFSWGKITHLLEKCLKKRISSANREPIVVSTTIFDIVTSAMKEDFRAIKQLEFIDNIFAELAGNLNNEEKNKIKPTIERIFKTLDYTYLNFVGEIAVLNNIISTGRYKLIVIEYKIEEERDIDFLLQEIESGKKVLVEVFRIHINPEKVSSDIKGIKEFLKYRFQEKIKSKTNKIDFILIPILRGAHESLKVYSDFYKKNSFVIENVVVPLAFMTIFQEDESVEHRFGRISNVFETEENYSTEIYYTNRTSE